MCRSAQKAALLKELMAEIRAAAAKWKDKRLARPPKAKPLGATFALFRKT